MKMTGERYIPGRMMKHAEVEHMHRYYAVRTILQGKKVLDAACGTGYGSSIISEYAEEVVGIDISAEAVDYARKRYGSDKVEYRQGSVDKLDFPDHTFDAVVSFETIEHVDEELQLKFLDEIHRVLKDDGILIMSTPNKKIYTDDETGSPSEWHVHEFYEEEYDSYLKRRFPYIKWYNQYICKASQLVEQSETQVRLLNYDMYRKGKFFITIAGKQPIDAYCNMSSSYYYPDQYDRVNDLIQVYYRTAPEQFDEANYEMTEIEAVPGIISEKIYFDGQKADSLRIDPLSRSCRMKLRKIVIHAAGGVEINADDFITNADESFGREFTFQHTDPQFIIELGREYEINYVEIEFEILETMLNLYPRLVEQKRIGQEVQIRNSQLEEQNRLLQEQFAQERISRQRELEAKQRELRVLHTELEAKQAELEAKQAEIAAGRQALETKTQELEMVYGSKSWRYTAVFRKKP